MSGDAYGASPHVIGSFDFAWSEYMHYLYLPVQMPDVEHWRDDAPDVRLPRRLEFLREVIEQIVDNEQHDGYVYVTARRGFATPGNPLNRPGWHADGFGTTDINYIWHDGGATLFAEHSFGDISDDHVLSVQQFERRVDRQRVRSYPDRTLLRLDPFVVHAAPEIAPPGGERAFLKISLSQDRYNLRGNSHNHAFDYAWRMWSRDEVRNDPAYAGGDAGPQEAGARP